ncbi:MAG: ABC transporter ATP-binding protein [Acidobacteriota bacterium]
MALDGIDLALTAGELVSLVGASGSGKSTLLNLIGGMDRPSSGRIIVNGRDLRGLSDAEAARYRRETVGFVFQFFNLIPTLDVLDNIALPARLAGAPASDARERAAALLDRVGLVDRRHANPDQLSGGQQQRVAVARALINDAPLVLADEPTGNLDRQTGQDVLDLLGALVEERGFTLLLATHSADAVERSTRCLRLRDGRFADES